MKVYADATTLIALGTIGELELFESLAGEPVVLGATRAEVTSEPAAMALKRAFEESLLAEAPDPSEQALGRATVMLDDPVDAPDTHLVGAAITGIERDGEVGVVSDDRRVRTVCQGLGARVTGTIGLVVRSVEAGLAADEAKAIIIRLDRHGLHMTASLREHAENLVDDAAG